MKRIAMSLMTIATIAVLAVGATGAYFSDSRVVGPNTFTTGTVKIGSTYQMPITVSGLYPGAVKTSDIFAVNYDGTIKGDLYFGFKNIPGYANLEPVLQFQVERVNADGSHVEWIYTNWVNAPYPFTNWTKLASGLNQGEWAYYKAHVKMSTNAGNEYQGATAYNNVVLYAVQEGGPYPAGAPETYELP